MSIRKSFIALAFCAFTFSSRAETSSPVPENTTSREIAFVTSFNQVEVWGNVTIVLVEDSCQNLLVTGATREVNRLSARVRKNRLTINASYTDNNEVMTVYVSASMLKLLVINGNATIRTEGAIKSENLKIVLNGASDLKITSFGKVAVTAGEGITLE
ncbi:MAG: DUF2807 domain-containing protein [Gemmatimonadaceae bacterium]|nr:DUF2807 domain-containing protein [Chitinophagaceae bacterium]